MTALLLAAASAVLFGSADFCGGSATRKAHPVAVTTISQFVSIPLIVVAAVLVGGTPSVGDLGYGAAAGTAGLVGLVLLYKGLSSGAMAVVAPTTAVTAALVPLLAGLALERWPEPLALVGVLCAVVAIGLVSLAPNGVHSVVTPRLLASAIAAGVAFGVFFIALDRAATEAGMWPLVSARIMPVTLGAVFAVSTGVTLKASGKTLWWVVGAGVLDVSANMLYVLATQQGALSIVAPIASLYPASTVLLALALNKERIRPAQIIGLGLAAAALVLVSGAA